MKKIEKLLPAIFMMLVSVALLATSTFAWFSMNKTVTVTGMVVRVRATDNIMIAEDNDEDDFEFSLDQVRSGNLRPASTIDGVNYFYPLASNVGNFLFQRRKSCTAGGRFSARAQTMPGARSKVPQTALG